MPKLKPSAKLPVKSPKDPRLDRVPSDTTEHLERFPFTASQARQVGVTKPTPVVIGVNWYAAFDNPVKGTDRRWRIKSTNLGRIRGGHCVMLPAKGIVDAPSWNAYYDQGSEGRCVQFGISRLMSHLNRRRYNVKETPEGRWLYWQAQMMDEWDGGEYPGGKPTYSGTSVRAGLEVVRQRGLIRERQAHPWPDDGISAYRWVQDIDDLLAALGRQGYEEIPLFNSWNVPPVWWPVEVHERLLREDGEYGLVTDR